MNRLTWIGIIVWGVFVSGIGLMGTATGAAGEATPPQDVMFLLAGGILTCLIGSLGLFGCMGWIPGLHIGQKNYS